MASTIVNGEIKVTELSLSPNLRGSDLFLAATHLDGSAAITTQAISSCVILDYVLNNGPYNFGPSLSSLKTGHSYPPQAEDYVCDVNQKHFSIIPNNPAGPQSVSQIEAPNCTTDSYYSNIGGGTGNTVWGAESTIGGGCYNTVMDNHSVIAGGKNNFITCCASTIAGGESNCSQSKYSTIGGGVCNNISNQPNATIAGGFQNNISSSLDGIQTARGGTISGGSFNALSGCYGFVGGGQCNEAKADLSSITGGSYNVSEGLFGSIGGGTNNLLYGRAAVISGGERNILQGNYSSILGGQCNSIDQATHSAIGTGFCNQISGDDSVIIAGHCNNTLDNQNFIATGCLNSVSGDYSSIINGHDNTVSGAHSTIVSGAINQVTGEGSNIINGCSNIIGADNSSIISGYCNTVTGDNGLIAGGCCNIVNQANSTIINGICNTVNSLNSFIAGGCKNDTNHLCNTFILGSDLKASKTDFTYVNNLSSGAEICAATNVCATNVCAIACIGSGGSICASNTICGDYICGRSCVNTPHLHASICSSSPLVSSQYLYNSESLFGNKVYANTCIDTYTLNSHVINNIGSLTNTGVLSSNGTLCSSGTICNTGTICNVGLLKNIGSICNTQGSVCSTGDIVTTSRFISGGQDLLELFNSYTAGSGFYKTPEVVQFTGDGTTTRFYNYNFVSVNPRNYLISIAGLMQRPNIDFTASLADKGAITFTTPPPAGHIITVYANQSSEVGKSIMGFYNPAFTTFNCDGVSVDYALPNEVYNGPDTRGYVVTVTGLVQRPETDFSVLSASDNMSGILRFTSAPPKDGSVTVHAFKFSTFSVYNSIFDYLSASNFNIPLSSVTLPSITAIDITALNSVSTPYLKADRIQGKYITGDLTISGNLSALGTTTFVGSIVSNTSALSVINFGPAPSLYVGQYSTQGDIASFYDLDQNVEVLHVGGVNGVHPNVGILTSTPNKTLTVNGEISASSDIYGRNIYSSESINTNTLSASQQINVYGNLVQQSGSLSARHIIPISPLTYDIGQITNKFNNIYANNFYGSLNVDQLAGVLPASKGGTGGATTSDGIKNLLAGLGTGASGYVLKTAGLGSYYWAAETGSSVQVGTTISSTRTTATATANQSLFSAPTYTPGSNQLRVYINGVRQSTNDYVETSSTSFTLNTGCNVGDYVLAEVDAYYYYPNQASATSYLPGGNVQATNVQSAIAELDTEKVAKAGDSMSGDLTMSGATINLAAGTASNAPLKFASGTNLSTTQAGAVEFDGTNVYVTNSNSIRNAIVTSNDARLADSRTPTGDAGGDLSGNYPNPSVAKINGMPVTNTATPVTGHVLTWNGTSWVANAAPGTVSSSGNGGSLIGSVSFFGMASPPTGWVECNGQSLSKTANSGKYSDLFNVIGYTFGGSGDSFNVPDLRDEFIRGWVHDRTGTPGSGRAFGTWQDELFKSHDHPASASDHTHSITDNGHTHTYNYPSGKATSGSSGNGWYGDNISANTSNSTTGISINSASVSVSVNSRGGIETRPRNVTLMPCICYASIFNGNPIGAASGDLSGLYPNPTVAKVNGVSTSYDTGTTTLTFTGNLAATQDIIAYSSSDERLKFNISSINNALDKIENIKGVEFEWNTELQKTYNGNDVGVLAQDIERVIPSAVIMRENGYKGVNYEKIIPLLIESIKELKREVEELKKK